MKLSFLILFFLVLSGAGGSAEQNIKSEEIRTDKHQESPKDVQTAAEKQPEIPTPFQTQLIETLRTLAQQQKAACEQNNASQKSWDSPSVLVNIALVIVGAAYIFFAWRQWQAIRRQANIAAEVNRPFLMVQRPSVQTQLVAGQTGRVPYDMRLKVKNYGIGPADIIDFTIKADFFDWHDGSADPKPTYRPEDRGIMIDSVMGAGEVRQFPNLPFDARPQTFEAMKNDSRRLAFHGIINYSGASREHRYWTKFFWWYFPDGQKLVRANTPELNAHT